jgi:hypothetical protein
MVAASSPQLSKALKALKAPQPPQKRSTNSFGLVRRGAAHKAARLTKVKVYQIRRLYDKKTPLKKIAERFGISITHAHYVGRRRYWGHLPEKVNKRTN